MAKKASKQQKRLRREQLRTMRDRLELPVAVAAQLLASVLSEASVEKSAERERWRAEYRQEQATYLQDSRALKARQAEQIAATFGVPVVTAREFLNGTIGPEELAGRAKRAVQKRLKEEKKRREQTARQKRLQATCDQWKVPVVVVVQLLAGVLSEADVEESPERERWRAEYRQEQAAHQQDSRALETRQAEQVAAAFGVPVATARKVLAGQKTLPYLIKAAKREAQQRREQEQRERRRQWILSGISALENLEMPGRMAVSLLIAPGQDQYQKEELSPEQWQALTGGLLSPIDLDADPAEVAGQVWESCLDQSGFEAAEELIAAWQNHRVWSLTELEQIQYRQRQEGNAGMQPEHITDLCSAGRIEDTLTKIFHLNHWAKARDRLLYVDRQGLYQVKARLLEEAYRQGHLQVITYIDAKPRFAPLDDVWLDLPVDWFADVLIDSFEDDWTSSWAKLYPPARRLYRLATGQEPTPETVQRADLDAVEAHMRQRLAALQDEAKESRRAIPAAELETLFISPDDVAIIAYDAEGDHRFESGVLGWDELGDDLLSRLDPEFYSLVSFCYRSEMVRYFFCLPFRIAERFVPERILAQLQASSEATREAGEFSGREITEEESLAHPIRDLLVSLGVNIEAVCPQGLVDKEEYVAEIEARRAARYYQSGWEEEDDWPDRIEAEAGGYDLEADAPKAIDHLLIPKRKTKKGGQLYTVRCAVCNRENSTPCRKTKLTPCDMYVCPKCAGQLPAAPPGTINVTIPGAAPGGWEGVNIRPPTEQESAALEKARLLAAMVAGEGEYRAKVDALLEDILGIPGKKIVTIAIDEQLHRAFDIDENGTIGYHPDHMRLFKNLLATAFEQGAGITIRQFLDFGVRERQSDGREIFFPRKNLYGIVVRDGEYRPLPAREVEWAHNTDAASGEPLPLEKYVFYCDFPQKGRATGDPTGDTDPWSELFGDDW